MNVAVNRLNEHWLLPVVFMLLNATVIIAVYFLNEILRPSTSGQIDQQLTFPLILSALALLIA